MRDALAKACLLDELRDLRRDIVATLDDLSEYDVRRPLTVTGTNLLGLVKHLAIWESRYFGEVFNRPCPEPLPARGDADAGSDLWATEQETRAGIVGPTRGWRSTRTPPWPNSISTLPGTCRGGRGPT